MMLPSLPINMVLTELWWIIFSNFATPNCRASATQDDDCGIVTVHLLLGGGAIIEPLVQGILTAHAMMEKRQCVHVRVLNAVDVWSVHGSNMVIAVTTAPSDVGAFTKKKEITETMMTTMSATMKMTRTMAMREQS
jgi:hypothetical protein